MVTHDSETVDEVLEAFGHELRRETLRYFDGHQEAETPIYDLVNHIEQREPTINTERVEMQLHHSHLPKLEELGWLEYESERRQITYHGHEEAEEILSEMIELLDS